MSTTSGITSSLAHTCTSEADQKFSHEELRNKLSTVAIKTLKALSADNLHRMNNYQQNRKLLKIGAFYASSYYTALTTTQPKERFTWLRENGYFFHGYAPNTHFSLVPDPKSPTKINTNNYIIKSDVTPSQALATWKTHLIFLDCVQACEVAYYTALQAFWGTEKFDAVFSGKSNTPLHLTRSDQNQSLPLFMQQPVALDKDHELQVGEWVAVKNCDWYPVKHKTGEGSAWNLICVGSDQYVGFGLNGIVTGDQVEKVLLNEFNKEPISLSIVSDEIRNRMIAIMEGNKKAVTVGNKTFSELELQQEFANVKLSQNEFVKRGGGQWARTDFHLERIAKIAELPLEKIRDQINIWQKELADTITKV